MATKDIKITKVMEIKDIKITRVMAQIKATKIVQIMEATKATKRLPSETGRASKSIFHKISRL